MVRRYDMREDTSHPLPPNSGPRVRGVLVFFAVCCLLPVLVSLVAVVLATARAAVDTGSRGPILAVGIGAGGVLAGIGLGVVLLRLRSQVLGDSVRCRRLGTLGWSVLLLGGALLAVAVIGVFVGAFGLRGALDVVLASLGLALAGVVGMGSGVVIASLAARAVPRPTAAVSSSCSRCGAGYPSGARFCSSCGARLG